jgi:hypothetical protein
MAEPETPTNEPAEVVEAAPPADPLRAEEQRLAGVFRDMRKPTIGEGRTVGRLVLVQPPAPEPDPVPVLDPESESELAAFLEGNPDLASKLNPTPISDEDARNNVELVRELKQGREAQAELADERLFGVADAAYQAVVDGDPEDAWLAFNHLAWLAGSRGCGFVVERVRQ